MNFCIKPLAAVIALSCAALAQADGNLEGRISDTRNQTVYSGAVIRLEMPGDASMNRGCQRWTLSITAGSGR